MIAPSADEDTRPYPVNGKDLPTFVRAMFWFSGAVTIVVGLVFIGSEFNAQTPCSNDGCIGPSLRFGSTFTIDGNLNNNWKSIFSLSPSRLVGNWTPVFFGIISVTAHFPGFHYAWVTKTWFHCALWNVFLAIFGHLGYGGNLGVIFGVFTIVVGFMCLGMQFTKWKNERPTLHMTTGSCVDRFSFMADNEIMHVIGRSLGLCAAIMTFIVGWVSVFTNNFNYCPQGIYTQCMGPSIRWNDGSAGQGFVEDANGPTGWRSFFTFDPEFFCRIWGPIFLGYFTMVNNLQGRSYFFYSSWPRVCLWMLFLGLFANFGYAGSLGVISGFLCVFVAFVAFLISIGGGTSTPTAFQVKIHGFN